VEVELRPIEPADGPALHTVVAHPDVWRWLVPADSTGPITAAECDAWARRDAAHWTAHGFGKWLVLERGAVVARGGLGVTFVEGRAEVEIGWAVRRDRWGRGLATFVAREAVAAGAALGLESVVAFTRTDNRASLRVMEKAGLRVEREFEHAGWPHILCRAPRRA
jgi:RimJ/RimL family protein N-acetyltransferase